ncbi:MerR family transcriptional regulator [Calidifontibacter sp. DB0510]|uniref:MerR family transcriptional regulator n=1 Tax=Metallococcus carri TaxID=1656884 RepID=A0A967AYE2_9MICO|nr:MerR family transcriptional regulator [Metallococcus carri]NHN54712.1 MerR family transcriptional regulator [Metallococcus carri]NOP37057.1 MerR family transcriptional regulator [Calidifontibacter sp. DB2511S]
MSAAEPGLSIGAVLAQLREEFPDLSVSKVRFLDAQGVVSPQRTSSGYRKYRPEDVDRLRFVLRAQRDRFWPLKVIREALDAYDRGLQPEEGGGRPVVPAPAVVDGTPSEQEVAAPVEDLRLTATELSTATGLDADAVQDLVDFALIRPDAKGHFDGADLQVAHAAATLLSYGVQARHLRPFRLAADRELGLIDQLLLGPSRSDAAEVAQHCLALHLALVRAGLPRG